MSYLLVNLSYSFLLQVNARFAVVLFYYVPSKVTIYVTIYVVFWPVFQNMSVWSRKISLIQLPYFLNAEVQLIIGIDNTIIEMFLSIGTLREMCLFLELLWSAFSHIWTKDGETLRISPHSVGMWENTDQNSSEPEHFLRSARFV